MIVCILTGASSSRRRWVQLCAEKQDLVPVRHGHLGTHSSMKSFTGHRYIVNLIHVTAAIVVSYKGPIVRQFTFRFFLWCRCRWLSSGHRIALIVLDHFKIVNRRSTHETRVDVGNLHALFFFIKDVLTHSALIFCHYTSSSSFLS